MCTNSQTDYTDGFDECVGRLQRRLVSVFQGSLLVIVIMIDDSEKRNNLNFRVRVFVKSAVN